MVPFLLDGFAARKPAGIPVVLACLPFYHSYGLSFYFLAPCLAPYTLVILPRWDLGSALESIPKYFAFPLSFSDI